MTEIATLNARRRGADGSVRTATFGLCDDGSVTRQITSVDGVAEENKPALFRVLGEDDRRACADAMRARLHLADVIASEGWTVTS